jgi:hypothetical protein
MSPARAPRLLSNSVIVERDVFTRAPTEQVTAHAVGHTASHPESPWKPTRFRHSPKSSDIPRWPPCCSATAYQHAQLSAVALDPPFPIRTVALLTREGTYQTAGTRAFTRLNHEYVRTHLTNNP